MIGGLEKKFLAWLRVPPEPAPPAGSPGSARVFRAGRNYLRLRLVVWTGAQLAAVLGIVASLSFVREIEIQAAVQAAQEENLAALARGEPAIAPLPDPELERTALHQLLYDLAPHGLRDLPKSIPTLALPWVWLGELVALAGFVLQLFGSFITLLLDYRLRWYIVTDRSLRLRWGVFNIQETTMSFANLQHVAVHQGPLQRLLGLADVEVQSAGGGSSHAEHGEKESMHRSLFHAVDNAAGIRDLILARLQRFRQSGLGDPDDAVDDAPAPSVLPPTTGAAIEAALVLRAELRDWRASLRG